MQTTNVRVKIPLTPNLSSLSDLLCANSLLFVCGNLSSNICSRKILVKQHFWTSLLIMNVALFKKIVGPICIIVMLRYVSYLLCVQQLHSWWWCEALYQTDFSAVCQSFNKTARNQKIEDSFDSTVLCQCQCTLFIFFPNNFKFSRKPEHLLQKTLQVFHQSEHRCIAQCFQLLHLNFCITSSGR